MSARSIPEKVPEENSSFLRGCLVEGDSVQEARLRRSKRRALLISIAAQFLIIASLVLFPLFSKGENIANRVIVLPPIPFPKGAPAHPRTLSQPTHGRPEVCRLLFRRSSRDSDSNRNERSDPERGSCWTNRRHAHWES